MKVIVIMACALVGTIALLFLAGSARWSFIYLIRYRLLKSDVTNANFEMSTKKDIMAIVISVITLIALAVMLIFGVPFVVEHISEFSGLDLTHR